MVDDGDELAACAVCEAEFFAGIAPTDRAYWRQVFSSLTYWEISPAAAQRAGELRYDFARQGQALSITDCLLAALDIEHGAVLVTNNARHCPMPGVQVLALR
jgi:predicted nucleic acid-binding protein